MTNDLRFILSSAKRCSSALCYEERQMPAQGPFRRYTTAFVAIALLGSSAASAAPRTIDPLVALSVFGTSESRAAVCAAGSQAVAAAGAAVAAQAGTGSGCVLPAVDAAPPPAVAEALPPAAPPPPVVAGGGIGVLPLLLALAAIAGAAALILDDDDDGEVNLPISP
jgi:hypothetical protein